MQFPRFDHARHLADAWRHGAPRHNLGASAFTPAQPLQGLPKEVLADDLAYFDLHAETAFRDAVAAHLGVAPERVRPAAGTSAANAAVIATAIQGGVVLCERPHYTPMASLATGFGADVRFVDHGPEGLDAGALADRIGDDTDLVLLASPNNPTGRALAAADMQRIGDAAAAHDTWVLIDQVYRELTDHPLADHPAVIHTASLNKCWGAPGLRAGWAMGEPSRLERVEETHRVLNLGPSAFGTRIGAALLQRASERRALMAARLAANHPIYEAWARSHGLSPRHGDLIAFPAVSVHDTGAWSKELLAHGILTIPGEMFDQPGHIRIGLGIPTADLQAGLEALSRHLPAQS